MSQPKEPENKFPSYSTALCTLATLKHTFLLPVAQQPNSGLCRLIVEVSISHTIRNTQPLGLVWARYQFGSEAATYTENNIHKIRTSMPSAVFETAIPAVERLLRLRPHGHRNRPSYVLQLLNKPRNKHLITHTNTCTYIHILFKKSKVYIKHAAHHTTHNHNQAHSKQLMIHTQNTTCCHSTNINITK